MKTKALICVAALAITAGAARSQGKKREAPPMLGRETTVRVGVKTDKAAYKPGDVVSLTLSAKNPNKEPVTLQFSSGQKYDFEIRKGKDGKGAKVWHWAEDKMFTEAMSSRAVKGNEMLTFTEKSAPITEKGTYWVQATVTTTGRTPRPFAVTTFVVK